MAVTGQRGARAATLLACLGLVGYYSLHSLWLGPSAPNITVWLLQILPLGFTLPGLLIGSPRSYQWLCFLILAYFISAVLTAFSPGRLLPGLLEIGLCLLAFCSAIVFVNSTRRRSAAAAESAPSEGGTP